MRAVNLQSVGLIRDPAARDAIKEIEKASAEVDLITIAQAFTTDDTFTEVRELNVTAPSLANIAAVLATFLADCKRGGQHRTN